MRRLLVVVVVAMAVLTAAVLLGSCGTATGAAEGSSPSSPLASTSADQPPAWLWKEAWRKAAEADGPVDGGYWGLLGDPEYGELMDSGPRDPSHPKVWVLVLIGRFDIVNQLRIAPGASLPPGPVTIVEYTYTEATHEPGGVFGAGWGEFDPSPYPHLRPLDLSAPPPDAGGAWPTPPAWLRERALR